MQTNYRDVIIAGGGPAGLSAALYLGRSCKSALVIDAGNPRHAVSERVHGFPTRDGVPPSEYRRLCWEELACYPTVERFEGEVTTVEETPSGLRVYTAGGQQFSTQALLLAVGVADVHPEIPGLDKLWGKLVFHCPYCHAWELRDKPLATLCRPPIDCDASRMLRGWSQQVTCFSNGHDLDADTEAMFERYGVRLVSDEILELQERPESELPLRIVTVAGEQVDCAGLFIPERHRPVTLVTRLGLDLEDDVYIKTDSEHRSLRSRIWAAGDCTKDGQAVLASAAQGGKAAKCINASLVFDDDNLKQVPQPQALRP